MLLLIKLMSKSRYIKENEDLLELLYVDEIPKIVTL